MVSDVGSPDPPNLPKGEVARRIITYHVTSTQIDFLEPLPEAEAMETVFKYAQLEDIPVTDATAST